MQSDYKEVIKITSWKTGVSEQLYKDMCSFIFAKTAENLKKPTRLIIKLRGIGSWYLRKKRLLIKIKLYEDFHDPDWAQSVGIDGEQIPEILKIFRQRLEDYEKYVNKRKEIKKYRDEYKKNMASTKREDSGEEETEA